MPKIADAEGFSIDPNITVRLSDKDYNKLIEQAEAGKKLEEELNQANAQLANFINYIDNKFDLESVIELFNKDNDNVQIKRTSNNKLKIILK